MKAFFLLCLNLIQLGTPIIFKSGDSFLALNVKPFSILSHISNKY